MTCIDALMHRICIAGVPMEACRMWRCASIERLAERRTPARLGGVDGVLGGLLRGSGADGG